MQLGDMLRVLREDILRDRSDLIAGQKDYLWSDATLVMYIDEAVRRFAKRTLCIRDGTTSAVTTVTTASYQENYPLDPSVLAVLSAKHLGNGTWVNGVLTYPDGATYHIPPDRSDLSRAGHSNLNTYHTPDTYFFNPNDLQQLPPGKPMAFTTDEFTTATTDGSIGVINFHIYPIISPEYAGCTIHLRVARMPLVALEHTSLDVVPEVPDDYHLNILDYAAYLALRIVDHELGDPERAEQFRQSFELHVIEAKAEMEKRQFQPNLWGFGHSGYSYVGN